MEVLGILIAMVGSAIIAGGGSSSGGSDKSGTIDNSNYSFVDGHNIVVGDLIAFLGSVFGAFNLQVLAPLLQFYREGIYLVLSNICVIVLSLISVSSAGYGLSPGFDGQTGVLGFLNPKYLHFFANFKQEFAGRDFLLRLHWRLWSPLYTFGLSQILIASHCVTHFPDSAYDCAGLLYSDRTGAVPR